MSNSDKLDLLPGLWWLVDTTPIWAVLKAILISPLILLGITGVLEGRRPAPWYHQFRSFLPGDIFLAFAFGFMVALSAKLPEREAWWNAGWMQLLAVVGAGTVFFVGRYKVDAGLYSFDQLVSPTKVYHDFVLFLGYGYLLIKVGIATLFGVSWSEWPLKLAVFGFLALWGVMLVNDGIQPKWRRQELANHAHTADWRPIWHR